MLTPVSRFTILTKWLPVRYRNPSFSKQSYDFQQYMVVQSAICNLITDKSGITLFYDFNKDLFLITTDTIEYSLTIEQKPELYFVFPNSAPSISTTQQYAPIFRSRLFTQEDKSLERKLSTEWNFFFVQLNLPDQPPTDY